jgi:hypothetical protein
LPADAFEESGRCKLLIFSLRAAVHAGLSVQAAGCQICFQEFGFSRED